MINQTKYIVQGAIFALLFIIIISAFQSSLFNLKLKHEPIVDTSAPVAVVYTITNIEGQKLFSEKCSSCHALFKRGLDLLDGVEDRVQDKALLREWIRNSSKVLRSGNPYFNAQVKEYGVRMSDFPELTDQQIDDILDYINQAKLMQHGNVRP